MFAYVLLLKIIIMKKLIAAIALFMLTFLATSAQYIEGQENNHQDGIMTITTLWLEEPKVCTMEYAPVCAQMEVQCFASPCYPVYQTFSNTCQAWENKILFQGSCTDYINADLHKKLENKRSEVEKIISKIDTTTLIKLNERIDQHIKMTKMSRIAVEMQKEKITKYAFIKSVVNEKLMK